MKNKERIIIIIVSVISYFIGYFLIGNLLFDSKDTKFEEKKYSSNGFTITMDEGFQEKDLASTTVYLVSKSSIVTALKEEFNILEPIDINKDSTLEEYTNAVLKNNKKELEIKSLSEKIKYFTYDSTVNGKDYSYMSVTVKGSDAFWVINFACDSKNKDTHFPKFEKWAKTIEVK